MHNHRRTAGAGVISAFGGLLVVLVSSTNLIVTVPNMNEDVQRLYDYSSGLGRGVGWLLVLIGLGLLVLALLGEFLDWMSTNNKRKR